LPGTQDFGTTAVRASDDPRSHRFPSTQFAGLFVGRSAFVGGVVRDGKPAAERFLAWILLLPIGVTGLWAGISHIFFPAVAAAHIGWQVSPFQFEVGTADLAIGVTACIAFWRDLAFRAAAVCAASVFLLGDAIGHIREMAEAGNFAPGNAGLPFYMDIICPVLAIALVAIAKRQQAGLLKTRR
jgi:disulfide bond formation protein DsbB